MTRTTRNVAPIHKPDNRPISVIIPAAGCGRRMRSYGPRSLLKIKDNMTILENQIRCVNKYLYNPEIIIVSGFQSYKIENSISNKKRNISIIDNKRWETTNIAASIALGVKKAKNKNILVIYGDLVFNAWTLRAPLGPYSLAIVDKKETMKKEEVGTTIVNNLVENMMFDLPNKWAQIAYFTGNEYSLLLNICSQPQYYNRFGFEIINMIIDGGGKFMAYSNPRMKITDIDSSKDLCRIKDVLL